MNLIIPPFVPLIRFMLWIAVLLSGWLAYAVPQHRHTVPA
jgi:hypothetical protein